MAGLKAYERKSYDKSDVVIEDVSAEINDYYYRLELHNNLLSISYFETKKETYIEMEDDNVNNLKRFLQIIVDIIEEL